MVDKNDTHVAHEEEMMATDELVSEDFELEDDETSVAQLQHKLKQLRTKLAQAEEEKRKYLEEVQRSKADFLNSRRRLEEQLERDKVRATDKILMELLTLVDSFDTAMADRALWDTIDAKWRIGVEAIHGKLLSILKSSNVEPIDPLGHVFNPEEHEAVAEALIESDTAVDTIVTVLQKGFKRNDTIIRPARVVVGTKK